MAASERLMRFLDGVSQDGRSDKASVPPRFLVGRATSFTLTRISFVEAHAVVSGTVRDGSKEAVAPAPNSCSGNSRFASVSLL